MVKGAILVALAVIIGFVLLRDDNVNVSSSVGADDTAQTDDEGDNGTEGTDDTTAEEADSTTSLPPARDPSEVKVLVANGTNVTGAATTVTDALKSQNYITGNPTDATSKDGIVATSVYFTEGFEAEANAVASAINAPAESVQALPTPAPVADTQLAHVIIVLGPDLAQATG